MTLLQYLHHDYPKSQLYLLQVSPSCASDTFRKMSPAMAANSKHREEQTECLSDYGTITSAFRFQKYFDFVCYDRESHLSSSNIYRYYTISIILGTVALSYGSVPMYKMVRLSCDTLNHLLLILGYRYAHRLVGVVNPLNRPSIPLARILRLVLHQ